MKQFIYRISTGEILLTRSFAEHRSPPDPTDPDLAAIDGDADAGSQLYDHAAQALVPKPLIAATIDSLSVVAPATVGFTLGVDATLTVGAGDRIIVSAQVPAGAHEFYVQDAGDYEIQLSAPLKKPRRATLVAT